MSSQNYLFYSTKCNTCYELINILKNENLLNNFVMKCVDNMNIQMLTSKGITRVPTMIIGNTNKILIAGETFEWVKSMKFFRQKQSNQQTLIQNKVFEEKKPVNRFEYVSEEMNGISDSYAYTKIDNPQPKSFYYKGAEDETKNAIFTAPEIQKKMRESDQKKLISEELKKRKDQDKQHKEFAKQSLVKSVMLEEQRQIMEELNNPELKFNKKKRRQLQERMNNLNNGY
jgi:hypothetical protein